VRKLKLTKTGLNKIKASHPELKASDLQDSIRSFSPGEWVELLADTSESWIGYVNPLLEEKYACVQVLSPKKNDGHLFSEEAYIESKIHSAFSRRQRFKGYEKNCRLFYGTSDGLTGLIIDAYTNVNVIQINTAGLDRHREFIKALINKMTDSPSILLDNPKYREKEFLPTFPPDQIPNIEVSENDLRYELRADVLQKVGFYFDHRENRLQLGELLKRMNKRFERGVDLFCYAGSWGLTALKAGVLKVDFVDQADMGQEIQKALELNELMDKGTFIRSDVFKFLDQQIAAKETFDVILCDPPAFAKSPLQKEQALDGYSKLHRKVIKIASSGSILAFSSCTHYVTQDEFQRSIIEASQKEQKKLQLLHVGVQGWDHPITHLNERASYIKSYIYILE
jgi:23S rRNA (cytosine1962-C5)-methyltransferase